MTTPSEAIAEGGAERRLHPLSWLFVLIQQLKSFAIPLLVLLFTGRGNSLGTLGPAGRRRAGAGVAGAILHLPVPGRGRRHRHPQRPVPEKPAAHPVPAHPQRRPAPVAAAPDLRRGGSAAGIGRRHAPGGRDAGAVAARRACAGRTGSQPRPGRGDGRCSRRDTNADVPRAAVAAHQRGRAPGPDLQPRHDPGRGGDRRAGAGQFGPGRRHPGVLDQAADGLGQGPAYGRGRLGLRCAEPAAVRGGRAAPAVDRVGLAAVPRLHPDRNRPPAQRAARTADPAARQHAAPAHPGLEPARKPDPSLAGAAQPARGQRVGGYRQRPALAARPGAGGDTGNDGRPDPPPAARRPLAVAGLAAAASARLAAAVRPARVVRAGADRRADLAPGPGAWPRWRCCRCCWCVRGSGRATPVIAWRMA